MHYQRLEVNGVLVCVDPGVHALTNVGNLSVLRVRLAFFFWATFRCTLSSEPYSFIKVARLEEKLGLDVAKFRHPAALISRQLCT
jgi:hypothetical protein